MKVQFGKQELEYPSAIFGDLRRTAVTDGPDDLRDRLSADGYLYLPGLLPRERVMTARERVLRHMGDRDVLKDGTPVLDGVMPKGGKSVNMMGVNPVTSSPEVVGVLEAPELFELFASIYGEPASTFSYKWMRAVGNEQYTGSHYDVVYMGRGSARVCTVWIPIGDAPKEHGSLAICEGSHSSERFKRLRDTYGQMDVDRDNMEGWFSEDPREIIDKFGGRWLGADYFAGDVLIFGLYTLHASTTNTTNRFRLSCDVRYQPESEPIDDRWVSGGRGHYAWGKTPAISMEEARARWGV